MSTLVVEHHPDLRAPLIGQAGTLKVKGAHAQTKAVREDNRQRSVGIPHLADSQVDTVRRRDDYAAVSVEEAEILEFVRIVAADASA